MKGTAVSDLPALYAPWIEALLGGRVPGESEATCDSRAMLVPSSATATEQDAVFFDPRSKCCTYVPTLPNFLVGRILLDSTAESAAGRASVQARIAAGVGVTPAGLAQPATFALLYRNAADAFGRSVSMRCPHYVADAGTCGIWRHRNSVCTTWFCKHVRGAVGQRFWAALRHLLEAVERSLVAHCVIALDPGAEAIHQLVVLAARGSSSPLSAADLDGVSDAAQHRVAWGRYVGREGEFYEASARLVEHFTWNDVVRVAGAEVELAAALVQQAYAAHRSNALSARLQLGAVETRPVGRDHLRVTTYRPWDPLVIPKALGDALHFFDGRSTRSALASAAAETGTEIDRGVVRRLVDFEVLVVEARD